MPTFPKIEKLCGQKPIQSLHKEGKKFVVWPLRITYRPSAQPAANVSQPTKVVIWAPKSLFKHAVDRNRLRRQMREAYRLNKQPIESFGTEIAVNYIDKQMQPYETILKAMRRAISRIQKEHNQTSNPS